MTASRDELNRTGKKGVTMREIKFRAWDGSSMVNSQLFSITMNGKLEFNGGSTGIVQLNYPIMQFTGLSDKNGKEIYCGDILSSEHFKSVAGIQYKLKHIVQWSDDYLSWFLLNAQSMDENDGSLQLWVAKKNTEFEVIGNIYENPELLEGDQND